MFYKWAVCVRIYNNNLLLAGGYLVKRQLLYVGKAIHVFFRAGRFNQINLPKIKRLVINLKFFRKYSFYVNMIHAQHFWPTSLRQPL